MKTIFLTDKSEITDDEMRLSLQKLFGGMSLKKVLIIPPDASRSNSYAGPILNAICSLLRGVHIDIMPALGTHFAMTNEEISRMYPGIDKSKFLCHRWREDTVHIGEVPEEFVNEISGGAFQQSIGVEVNSILLDPSYDLILSVGQVVPHEVAGMSNFRKNIFVGVGGPEMINGSHMLGAVYGMERMMGRDHTPVHKVFDYAAEKLLSSRPIVYILTVTTSQNDKTVLNGLFIGDQRDAYEKAVKLSREINIDLVDEPLKKVVVYLPPQEFKSTWIGNKAVYRTRMAIADGGELTVIGPGIMGFGEDPMNDTLIRRYGYARKPDEVLKAVKDDPELKNNLSAAAHMIHGSSGGRFEITYSPGKLTREEIESVGYRFMDIVESLKKYDVGKLRYGFNDVGTEKIFFIPNPAIGLWAYKGKMEDDF